MGQRFSEQKVSLDIKVIMNKYFPQYQILKILNNGMLSKTLLILNDVDKNPLIIKVFLKHEYNDEDRQLHKKEVEIIESLQNKLFLINNFNIAPIIKLIDDYKLGIIFRQYIKYNLSERIYLMPNLSYIEKVWITFQLLVAVNNLSSLNLVHGDLKPGNILLTSNLSVYLSDFATYKKAYIYIDDIASYTYYYGSNNSADKGGCYLAPERLIERGEKKDDNKSESMDVFSLGVIIAELFIEKNLFNFSSLLNYKKGNNDLINVDKILLEIENEKIRKLIYDMIKIEPKERINISEALNYFTNEICPISMKGYIFQFNAMINSSIFWKPDLYVGHMYRYWVQIWKCLFGIDSEPEPLFQHLNLEIANKILLNDPFEKTSCSVFRNNEKGELFVDGFKLNFYPKNGKIISELFENKNIFKENENEKCVFIIIDYLLQAMEYSKYDSSKLLAMEMVRNLSKRIDDISKLKLIIPYYITKLKEQNYLVKISALNFVFEIFDSINYNDLILPVTEYNYFHIYVIPFLLYFSQNNELDYFNNIEKIIDIEKKFLDVTLKSRIMKLKEKDNEKNKNNKNINKKYLYTEVFSDYDNYLEEFKNPIFKKVMDIIGKKNDIDLLIVIIRKLPILLELFGKSKVDAFNSFIISNLNKTNWLLQKESLVRITEMLNTLGKKSLANYIIPCLDWHLTNNSEELKLIELIKSINNFLEMNYLSPVEAATFFNKLTNFILHPNIIIRNNLILLLKNIFSKLTQEESYIYLFESLNQYMKIPLLEINYNNIINNLNRKLSRIIFQLELNNINYKLFNNYECKNILPLMKTLIEELKKGNNSVIEDIKNKNNEEIRIIGNENICRNYSNNFYYNSQMLQEILRNKLNLYKEYSLIEPLEKFIKKELGITEQALGDTFEAKIFSRVYWISDIIEKYELPKYSNNFDFPFEDKNDNILSIDPFKITYVLKTLEISMKLVRFEELIKDLNKMNESKRGIRSNKNFAQNNLAKNKTISTKKKEELQNIKYLVNYNCNNSFLNWRPKGKIISTLYSHNEVPIEKILPMKENKFCTFDQEGNSIIYQINNSENDEFININKVWDFNCHNKYRIKYKNVFSTLDNITFVVGTGNKLVQYFPNHTPVIKDASGILCKSIDESDITCLQAFGVDPCQNQKIIFGSKNGSINISDQRINKVALYKKLSKERGIFNCICESFDKDNFLIGTLDGNLLEYDLRINDVINEYKYNDNQNIPILGINLYSPLKNVDYEVESFKNYDKYIVLWTGNEEHEISFWNKNKSYYYCDLFLTVNMLDYDDEIKPLPIEIPSLNKKNNIYSNLNHEFESNLKYLYKLSYNFNKSKKILNTTIQNDFYYYLNLNVPKICNLYENFSTVQNVLSPQIGVEASYLFKNTPYIISAGNDMTIRYWDFTKEKISNKKEDNFDNKKSYIINAHNNLAFCKFIKTSFNQTHIIQSNEGYNNNKKKNKMPGIGEYQYFNGVSFQKFKQDEFEDGYEKLSFCRKLSDAAHKSIITDLLGYNINHSNFLISSSWDGTIKIWK